MVMLLRRAAGPLLDPGEHAHLAEDGAVPLPEVVAGVRGGPDAPVGGAPVPLLGAHDEAHAGTSSTGSGAGSSLARTETIRITP